MLVPPLVHYALVLLGVALLILEVRAIPKRAVQARVPAATVASQSAVRRFARTWLPRIALLCGALAAFAGWWFSTSVVIVADGDHGPEAVRRVLIGPTPASYFDVDDFGDSRQMTWIVNRSSRTLTRRFIDYLDGNPVDEMSAPGDPIEPGAITAVPTVDYLGPHDVPPEMLAPNSGRSDIAANAGLRSRDERIWLTW